MWFRDVRGVLLEAGGPACGLMFLFLIVTLIAAPQSDILTTIEISVLLWMSDPRDLVPPLDH